MQSENLELVNYYIGIDVGTASVRAALVDQFGTLVAYAEQPIQIWAPQPDHYEQSSDDIWAACCTVTKKVVRGIDVSQIRGLGFDATCSLVVLDAHFKPLAVNSEGEHKRNIILWMDHRAADQVARINGTRHRVLCFVGGAMSAEMQPPKLLWMKENLRESCWEKAGYFFDLPDFLSWKATGATARSLCTLVCKWTYSSEKGWDDSFWKLVGLEDLVANNYAKIGNEVLTPGAPFGNGLTSEAAEALGLAKGTAVGASLIDAHAGGIGMIGARVQGHNLPCENQPITSRAVVICGTSSCHMAISKSPVFVPGVWGPYDSAMVPGFWLNEGGQSATGKLVVGLTLSQGLDDLALIYLATIQAIALGTRHIVETMQAAGHDVNTLFMCGGLSKNPLFVQMHADITGMPVVLAHEVESVLTGAAILGACASKDFASLQDAMEKMGRVGRVVLPNHKDKRFYDKKYQVFLKLVEHQREYKTIMQSL
ncbi:FGGY carbohydrate kinase domain-containing protein isoform X5 [Podarcis raffonei]|uniref:FGGY carbohydrate kinase domain-containing protein isoform X5 n=1 Tax=Podarcis raffonei TaxID=65483 RepID=UPI00232918F5|nr:FGGY carbohydrate kinase domain-containing protein isoform X5 [Podarcis raffonei]